MGRYRTHTCGELRSRHAGRTVRLSGWLHRRRDHGGVLFLDLRDHYGITQLVISPENDSAATAARVPRESVIRVVGEVRERSPETINSAMTTGEVEVAVGELEVLSASEPLPFSVAEETETGESMRLSYRFLDLRRAGLHRRIQLRSEVIASMRRRMTEMGFAEFRPLSRGTLPVRSRDGLRRAGGRLRRRGGTLLRSVSRVHRLASERPSLSPSLPRRGHAAFRHGQAGPALRAGDPGPVPHFRRLLVQAVPGDRRRRWGGPRIVRSQTRGPAALVLRRPRGVRERIGRPGAGLAHQRGPGHRIDRRGPRTEHDQQHHRGVLSRSGVGGPPHRRIAG